MLLNNIRYYFSFRKLPVTFKNWKIVRGDEVYVNSGKDKKKSGKVLKVYRKSNMVLVEGVNQKQKPVKGGMDGESKGGYELVTRPIHVSNVNLIDPELKKPTRVRIGFLESGEKVRLSAKTGTIIAKPDNTHLKYTERMKGRVDTEFDTPANKVLEVTYKGEDFENIKLDFDNYIKEKERIESLLVFDN